MGRFTTPFDLTDRRAMDILTGACDEAGAHIRTSVQYSFHPQGFSGVVILAESHASIHTWPERGEAVVDYFSCSDEPGFDEFFRYLIRSGFGLVRKQILPR